MDFALTEEQNAVRAFAAEVLGRLAQEPEVMAWGGMSAPARERLWDAFVASDLLSIGLPEQWSGSGGSVTETALICHAVGHAGVPFPYDCTTPTVAAAVARFGSDDLRASVLPRFAKGEVRVSMSALSAGPTAVLTARDGAFELSGAVSHVPAPVPLDMVLVPAALEPDGQPRLVLLDLSGPGCDEVTQTQATDYTWEAQLRLTGAVVAPDRVLGGDDVDSFAWLRQRAIAAASATQVGLCVRAVELAALHVRERRQFGRPLSDFQAVTQRLADALIQLDVMDAALWRLVSQLETGADAGVAASLAKHIASRSAPCVVRAAVHLHGGLGVDVTYPLALLAVMSKRLEGWLGGAGRHLEELGEQLAGAQALDELLLA